MTTVPVITCGEARGAVWCATCQEAWSVRVPLFADGVLAGEFSCCPGCGTSHAVPSAAVVDAGQPAGATENDAPRVMLPWPARLRAGWLAFRGRDETMPGCAYGDCGRRGSGRWQFAIPVDDGVYRYSFCRRKHRDHWAADNRFVT